MRRVPALVADRSRREEEARHAEQDDEERYRDPSGASGAKPTMSCRVHVENYPPTSRRTRNRRRLVRRPLGFAKLTA
jgi:hypothetical protein